MIHAFLNHGRETPSAGLPNQIMAAATQIRAIPKVIFMDRSLGYCSVQTYPTTQRTSNGARLIELGVHGGLRMTTAAAFWLNKVRPPNAGTLAGGVVVGWTLSLILARLDLEAGVDQPLNDDFGRVFGVDDFRWEVGAAEKIGEHVLGSELAHCCRSFRRVGCAFKNAISSAIACSICLGGRPVYL